MRGEEGGAGEAEGSEEERVLYLPTGCQELLETLHDARPVHCLLFADFDRLPDAQISGRNAPLVASRVRTPFLKLPPLGIP